jgi:hypothetical protein
VCRIDATHTIITAIIWVALGFAADGCELFSAVNLIIGYLINFVFVRLNLEHSVVRVHHHPAVFFSVELTIGHTRCSSFLSQ